MDVLLDLSAFSNEQSGNDDDDFNFKDDRRFITEHIDNVSNIVCITQTLVSWLKNFFVLVCVSS